LLSVCQATIFTAMRGVIYSEIIDFLIDRGISKSFVANKLSFSRQYLNQILSGKRNMPPETLDRINKVLGTSFVKPPEIFPHEELEASLKSVKEKPFWKDDRDTKSPV
jgi:transcriptional regulator with XRE-family HTH domain